MKVRYHSVTEVGRGWLSNDDSLLIDEPCLAFAVADGLGGSAGGGVASAAAVSAIAQDIKAEGCETLEDLPRVVVDADTAVKTAGEALGRGGIATTLTLACLSEGGVEIAHIGDSAAFLIRNGKGLRLTRTHRVGHDRKGLFDIVADKPGISAALEKALGSRNGQKADYVEADLEPDDRLVLATDGLTDALSQKEIIAIGSSQPEPKAAAEALCQAALERDGQDDTTIIVIHVDEV